MLFNIEMTEARLISYYSQQAIGWAFTSRV